MNLAAGLTITADPPEAVLEKVYRLRVAAWRTKMAIEPDVVEWREPLDETARHWVVLCGGEPVAAARLSIHDALKDVPDVETFLDLLSAAPAPIGSINRLVVHPSYRQHGLSRVLDEARLAHARAAGCRTVLATVSDAHRAAAVERSGFRYVGEGVPTPSGVIRGDPTTLYVLTL